VLTLHCILWYDLRMIKFRLKEMMYKKGRHNVTELAAQTEISRQTLSRIANNRAKNIHLDTLARLCHALDCQPGELLALVSEASASGGHSPR